MPQKPDNKMPSEVPLKQAWYKFASDTLRRAARKSVAKFRSLNMSQMNQPHKFESLINNVQKGLANWQEVQRIQDAMKEDVRDKLSSGDLVASGYPIGETQQTTKQLIEPEFWDNATIEWNKGTASDHIAEYRRIRVAVPEQAPVSEQVPAADTATKRMPGRPTERDTILNAIRVCDEADPEFKSQGRKSQKARIRDQIRHDHPNVDPYGSGHGDKTLEKYIREYYNQ